MNATIFTVNSSTERDTQKTWVSEGLMQRAQITRICQVMMAFSDFFGVLVSPPRDVLREHQTQQHTSRT